MTVIKNVLPVDKSIVLDAVLNVNETAVVHKLAPAGPIGPTGPCGHTSPCIDSSVQSAFEALGIVPPAPTGFTQTQLEPLAYATSSIA